MSAQPSLPTMSVAAMREVDRRAIEEFGIYSFSALYGIPNYPGVFRPGGPQLEKYWVQGEHRNKRPAFAGDALIPYPVTGAVLRADMVPGFVQGYLEAVAR